MIQFVQTDASQVVSSWFCTLPKIDKANTKKVSSFRKLKIRTWETALSELKMLSPEQAKILIANMTTTNKFAERN